MRLSSLTCFTSALVAFGWLQGAAHALEASALAVELRAVTRIAPPRVTLSWNPPLDIPKRELNVYRRMDGVGDWEKLATLPDTAVRYVDDRVSAGVRYEYLVQRLYDGGPESATGWISVGIRAPLITQRGRVILLVDDSMATPLAAELAQFSSDLIGDGWQVIRQDIARSASPASVRAIVAGEVAADPASTRALILFGRIPVPYSGNFAPDGHLDHLGAWPADAFYGDVDGTWTDVAVNETGAALPRHHNIPADGKYDQSSLPSDVELVVGRIDLSSMPIFGVSETELLRGYLVRDHQFRHRLGLFAAIPRRGMIDDEFGIFGGEGFASFGWRNFSALFGRANVRELDWFATLSRQPYLCTYGCGPGGYQDAAGVVSSADFAARASKSVFTFLFGSYFGDWDHPDNLLRAPLGGAAGSLGLVSAWAGRPQWFLHPLGLGATIGECARRSQNSAEILPAGYASGDSARGVHVALLGDPTLRLHPVRPPSAVVVRPGLSQIAVSWRSSSDSPLEGYLVTRAESPEGPFLPVRAGLVRSAALMDRSALPGRSYTYMVRAVKRESTNSGSYLNSSQGAFSAPVTLAANIGPEIDVSAAGGLVADGDTSISSSNGTDFGSVLVGQSAVDQVFEIHNPGPLPLVITAAKIVGGNAADFSVSGVPASVGAGATSSFTVSFQSRAVGLRRTRLTLSNNDVNEGAFDFTIGGLGAAPTPP